MSSPIAGHAAIWLAGDTRALAGCAAALALIVAVIAALRLAPFFAIMLGAALFAVVDGLAPRQALQAFGAGTGSLLGEIGLVVALGAVLGRAMTASGAADRIVGSLLPRPGPGAGPSRTLPWLLALCAMLVGLPLFFEVGLVVMLPIILSLSRRSGCRVMALALPALAGMTVLHALVPPHPGPLTGTVLLHADLGLTMTLGLLIALPTVVLAGPVYAAWVVPRLGPVSPPALDAPAGTTAHPPARREVATPSRATPSLAASLAVLLLPVVLMLGRTVARVGLDPHGRLAAVLEVAGEPVVAMVIAVLGGLVLLARGTRRPLDAPMEEALAPIAGLLLTIGAGGGLKQVLLAGGLAGTIAKFAAASSMPPVLLAWVIAVCLRQAIGSATVATVTTAGLLAPMLLHPAVPDPQGALHASLLVLSIGAGSVFFCHVNDAGFWMVRGFFGLDLRQTLWSWSVLQSIVSVCGLAATLTIWWLV